MAACRGGLTQATSGGPSSQGSQGLWHQEVPGLSCIWSVSGGREGRGQGLLEADLPELESPHRNPEGHPPAVQLGLLMKATDALTFDFELAAPNLT